jgi:hypothetical protein
MDKQGEWLLAYVEKCMRRGMSRVVGAFEHVPTGLCFDAGSARCQVRVEAVEPAMVRVMALTVCDVRPSAGASPRDQRVERQLTYHQRLVARR